MPINDDAITTIKAFVEITGGKFSREQSIKCLSSFIPREELERLEKENNGEFHISSYVDTEEGMYQIYSMILFYVRELEGVSRDARYEKARCIDLLIWLSRKVTLTENV